MSGHKKVLQAALGVMLAAGAALLFSNSFFPETGDALAFFGGLRFSVIGAGAGLSLLVLLLFAGGWIGSRGRRDPAGQSCWRTLDGLGFGLLPATGFWKVFEQMTPLGEGKLLPRGWSAIGGLTGEGRFLPCRTEAVLAILLFAAVLVWLGIRKETLPDMGDLMGTSAVLWGAVRQVTEGFRANPVALSGDEPFFIWLAPLSMAAVAMAWTLRAAKRPENRTTVWVCPILFLSAAALLMLIRKGVLPLRNEAAELFVMSLAAGMEALAVLLLGRTGRKRNT